MNDFAPFFWWQVSRAAKRAFETLAAHCPNFTLAFNRRSSTNIAASLIATAVDDAVSLAAMAATTSNALELNSIKDALPPTSSPSQNFSAADAVFNTYELREAILIQLPLFDILAATKVNKTWEKTIATSKLILRHFTHWRTN